MRLLLVRLLTVSTIGDQVMNIFNEFRKYTSNIECFLFPNQGYKSTIKLKGLITNLTKKDYILNFYHTIFNFFRKKHFQTVAVTKTTLLKRFEVRKIHL